MTGLSPTLARCFLVSFCLSVVSTAPTSDQTFVHSVRSTTETGATTTEEELEFKDVPIYEKEKLRKPPPGFKYVAVMKCNNDADKHTPSSDQIIGDQEKSQETTPPPEAADQFDQQSVEEEIVIAADKEAEANDPSVEPMDALTAAEEPIQSVQITEETVENEEPLAATTDTTEQIKTGPSFSLDIEGQPIRVAEAKPESDHANTDAASDAKVNPVETNIQSAQLQIVADNFDVVASVGLDTVTHGNDAIDETLETNGATDVNEDQIKNYTGYKVYRVTIPTEEAARWILKFEDVPGIEFWSDAKLLLQPRGIFVTSATDILVAPDVSNHMEESLKQARLPFEILINDVQEAIRNENPPKSENEDDLMSRHGHTLTWERYHTLDDIDSYLDYLKLTFPNFVTITEIGRTTENRAIKAVRLHQEGGRTNKKSILIDAGIHAREWITPATITYMIREIVDNPLKYDCIMNEFDWLFVPVLNPDGYAYTHSHNRMWRKTRSQTENIVFRQSAEASLIADRITRFEDDPILDDSILEKLRAKVASPKASLSCTGADANRNFDYHWLTGGSSRNPCSDTFAGSKPFSEPEARALRDLVLDNKDNLAMYISLHAYSQMWLIPWGHKQEKPEDYSDLYSLAKIGSSALETVNGVDYLIGSIPDLLYVASGSSIDWVKGAVGVKYTYTLELRDSGRFGFLLPAKQIIPTGKETWVALYASVIELAKRTYTDAASCPTLPN